MNKGFVFATALMLLGVGCGNVPQKPSTDVAKEVDGQAEMTPLITKQSNDMQQVVMTTSKGEITIELFGETSPRTVENFVKLASSGFYNGTRFHRVIRDFMIQGGDPLSQDVSKKNTWGTGGPGYQFKDEFNSEKLVKGSLAMANSGPNTNGSQFFIVTADATSWLDGKHTNFGRVVKGMDVVEAIEKSATDNSDKPITDILIQSITLLK